MQQQQLDLATLYMHINFCITHNSVFYKIEISLNTRQSSYEYGITEPTTALYIIIRNSTLQHPEMNYFFVGVFFVFFF